jgi:hypothetical protein
MTLSEPSTPVAEPVRMTVRVRRNIQDTFDLFRRDIGSWWPLDKASFGGDRASELHLEPFVGGRFYERYIDGEEHIGGRVFSKTHRLHLATRRIRSPVRPLHNPRQTRTSTAGLNYARF